MVSRPATTQTRKRESADATLAKNLVAARVIAGFTQQELAQAAMVSRATIAQLETGYSDPRLSTIVDLAQALGLPPIFLLLGLEEVAALTALAEQFHSTGISMAQGDLARMVQLVQSGLLKDRLRAARIGASVARSAAVAGQGEGGGTAPLSAAIFSAFLPGRGTAVGTLLGQLFDAGLHDLADGGQP